MGEQNPRRVAFDVLRHVSSDDAFANLALNQRLAAEQLPPRDAAFVTELVNGTCRLMGTYDLIIPAASGRKLKSLQPAVVDLLRLGSHQALSMDVPVRAAVSTTVELARQTVGQRVTGLVNAIMRKIGAKSMDQWLDELTAEARGAIALAIRHHHPEWVVRAYQDVLPPDEVEVALEANNHAPRPTLVVRPGLAEVGELAPAVATQFSPFGAVLDGSPASIPAVAEGRAGVQDEGSQLVAWALTRAEAPEGPWLDLCAGPGGKSALLAGLAAEHNTWLVASELQEHRARLVAEALAGYRTGSAAAITADGTQPAWQPGSFARVMADVPCTGLGSLRRRPDSRWRKDTGTVDELVPLQKQLLRTAIDSAMPGGVIAYVTCSPHRAETVEVINEVVDDTVEILHAADFLPEVPDAATGHFVQLWPHRHGTDAMFLSLLRRL